MRGGWHGKYLDVDLAAHRITVSETDWDLVDDFVGGKGLGLALLAGLDASSSALDPGNPMIFLTGPLTGTAITTSSRSCLVTRSPLTGGAVDSHAGGRFGTALKGTGYDYIVIRGSSAQPVYIHVTPERSTLEDACDLWGQGCYGTEDALLRRYPRAVVAGIGPAGENKVRFACISTDKYRQFGRGGVGAVMGSKNLKALVIEGKEEIPLADPGEFRRLSRELARDVIRHPERERRNALGTPMWVKLAQEHGRFLPTHNFSSGQFDGYRSLTSEAMQKELEWKKCGCHNCVIQCSKKVTYDGGDFEGPEYETVAYLGSGCEIADARTVAAANSLCDDLGLDTISCGVTISFAMEAAEKGLLAPADNSRIRFGSKEALLGLIDQIAHRQGIGDLLAEGTRFASRAIGQDSEYFAIHIGGMEISGVNPLGCYSMALNLATADFASHTRFWSVGEEMAGNLVLESDKLIPFIAKGHDTVNIRNSMIICDFVPFGLDRIAPFLAAATGSDYSADSLMKMGERIHTLSRLYNTRTGRTHADDVLPGRFHQEVSCAGLMEGQKIGREFFEEQVQEYFRYRGWDSEGRPTDTTLEQLDLAAYREK